MYPPDNPNNQYRNGVTTITKKKPEFIGVKRTKKLINDMLTVGQSNKIIKKALAYTPPKKKFNVSMVIYQYYDKGQKPATVKDMKAVIKQRVADSPFAYNYSLVGEIEAKSIRIEVDNGK